MTVEHLVYGTLVLAAVPALLSVWNHFLFRSPPEPEPRDEDAVPEISILIPARNEADHIDGALRAALASRDVVLEVVVLDDHSDDATAQHVRAWSKEDGRVRLETAPALPPGWCGKQHACACLAERARYDYLLFLDADVRMTAQAATRLTLFLVKNDLDLVSAFPRQLTGTFLEKLLIPLIEFLLLGYLPLAMARWSGAPGLAAGCGQVFLTRKDAYTRSGGHGAIRQSLHDGVQLPRAYRKAGLRTDVCSGARLFTCRMYESSRAVRSGLMKNAHEGIASPPLILPFTLLLTAGGVLPLVLAIAWLNGSLNGFGGPILWSVLMSYLPRMLNLWRFRQSPTGALLHPLAIFLFLVIQWQAFFRRRLGRPSQWKGRTIG